MGSVCYHRDNPISGMHVPTGNGIASLPSQQTGDKWQGEGGRPARIKEYQQSSNVLLQHGKREDFSQLNPRSFNDGWTVYVYDHLMRPIRSDHWVDPSTKAEKRTSQDKLHQSYMGGSRKDDLDAQHSIPHDDDGHSMWYNFFLGSSHSNQSDMRKWDNAIKKMAEEQRIYEVKKMNGYLADDTSRLSLQATSITCEAYDARGNLLKTETFSVIP